MRFLPRLLAILVPLLAPVLRAQVHINEFMASNPGRPLDPDAQLDMDGDSPDWIELRNAGTVTNLVGCALSDDPLQPGKWVFPSHSLAAGGYLVVYASGKNRALTGVQFHTNFKLASTEQILFSRPDGLGGWTVVHQVTYPAQRDGISHGHPSNNPALPPVYFPTDTPGAANSTTYFSAFAGEARFDVDRGFYDAPFTLTITNRTPGATLAYTLNGSEPSETNGIQVPALATNLPPVATLLISDSAMVRARAHKPGLGPSKVDTHTYIFWERVKNQSGPLPSSGITTNATETFFWGAAGGTVRTPAGPDWAVDPALVGDGVPDADRFRHEDLKSIPTVSLVTRWKDMFGPRTSGSNPSDGGIYVGAEAGVANEGVDRVASLELINPNGDVQNPNAVEGFQVDGRVHVFGGTSQARWKSYKLSLAFKGIEDQATSVYGPGSAPVQPGFILDARMNQTWLHPDAGQQAAADYVRDQVMADLHRAVGGHAPHDRAVHLFINGMYWGLYDLKERPDQHFAKSYLGGDADEWDVFKHSLSAATSDGSGVLVNSSYVDPAQPIAYGNSTALANFNALMSVLGATFTTNISTRDLRLQSQYEPVWEKLDRTGFIDYFLLNITAGNEDWSHKNYYASYRRADPQAKWRYHSWDAEHVFKSTTSSVINFGSGNASKRGSPHHLNHLVSTNAEYRIAFADRVQRHFFNDGALTVAGMQAAFNQRFSEIDGAIRGEAARWGDNRRPGNPYKRSMEWTAEKARILTSILPGRHASVLTNLRNASLYPATAAPSFSAFGGAVSNGYPLVLTATAGHSIFYTLDGSDPREAWTSNAVGTLYSGPVPLSLTATVRARARNGTVWSALTEAQFLVGALAAPGNLVVSEIHYNPPGAGDETEFLELLNTSGQTIDLSNVRLDGVDFTFAPATLLGAGQRVLVVKNRLAFEAQYGTGWNIAGEFQNGTGLSNSGELLAVTAANGDVLQSFTYPTPGLSDAGGHSLVRLVPSQGLDATNYLWRISAAAGGNPGASDAVVFSGDPHADGDGDRLPALVEYLLGTSDADAQSGPPGVTLQVTPSGVLALHSLHPQADDAVLVLEMCESLESGIWQPVLPGLQDPVPGTERCYYRLKATLR